MTAIVSSARDEDIATIRRLIEQTETPFDVGRELARHYARLWVVRAEGEDDAVGFLLAWEVADEVHVIDLVVDAEHRRRGFARALLQTLLLRAREAAARLVLLEVRRSNGAAITLYESFGFATYGERVAYYADGEDASLMQLVLR